MNHHDGYPYRRLSSYAPDAWPWTYHARQRFSLTTERLEVEVSITSDATDPMPAGFGLHPYLVRTPGARLRVDVGRMWVTDGASMPRELAPPPDLVSSGAGLNPSDLALDNNFLGFGGHAVAEWPAWQARLRIETAGPFACFVVFTPTAEDYFFAEPVSNCIDAFNLAFDGRSDTGILVVDPGQTVSGTLAFLPETGGRTVNRQTYATERLGALSDGVFAIVLTLLVLDLKIPDLPGTHTEGQMLADLAEWLPNLHREDRVVDMGRHSRYHARVIPLVAGVSCSLVFVNEILPVVV